MIETFDFETMLPREGEDTWITVEGQWDPEAGPTTVEVLEVLVTDTGLPAELSGEERKIIEGIAYEAANEGLFLPE